jgi:hypothetical protein
MFRTVVIAACASASALAASVSLDTPVDAPHWAKVLGSTTLAFKADSTKLKSLLTPKLGEVLQAAPKGYKGFPGYCADKTGKDNDDGERIPDNSDQLSQQDCQNLCDKYPKCTAFEYNPGNWCVINTAGLITQGTGPGTSATCYIKQSKGCDDIDPETMSLVSDGELANCEEAVGAVVAAGGTCKTDLGEYDPEFKGKTMYDLCCATCKAPNSDPIEKVCASNEDVCTQDLTEAGKQCWDTDNDGKNAICPDPSDTSDPIKTHACIECIQEVFGNEYRLCGCCVFPLLTKLGLDEKTSKEVSKFFPCH